MQNKKLCIEPNPKCGYYKKFNCCGYCPKCPPERQGLNEVKETKRKRI